MCDDYGYEEPRFDHREWRRAQKEHRCCACKEIIRKGDKYHHTSSMGSDCDKPSVFKHCARCWLMCEALWAAGAESIAFELDCGEKWEDHWSPEKEPIHLAFVTKDEAQKLVENKQ